MADRDTISDGGVLVGRDREMALLTAALGDAASGRGSVHLLEGEPGIGKTRLADSFARRADAAGARVLWGRCWEAGGAPAYWPWVQALRTHVRARAPDILAREVGSTASDLATILPEIGELLDIEGATPGSDPDAARFRLFDAVTNFLARIAEDRPLVVVLDDLHVADEPSLLLLRFAANAISTSRIVLIGALRTPYHDPAIRGLLAELTRDQIVRRTSLAGLSDDAVAHLIEITAGVEPSDALVRAISDDTGGNALFVKEIVDTLSTAEAIRAAEARRLPLPEGIGEAIFRRMAPLSDECTRTLTLASVFGREFGLDGLGHVIDLDPDELLTVLDEAEAAGIVAEIPGTIGELRFTHALVRDAVYDELSPSRRMQLHLLVGKSLERAYAENLAPHLSELAHHFLKAAAGGGADKAVRYSREAADRAVRLLAYEEAVRLYESALRALDLVDASDRHSRCELLLEIGDANLKAGDEGAAKDAFLGAAELARDLGARGLLGRAALGYGGRFVWTRPGADTRVIPLLKEALAALGDEDSTLRARLLARLAGALRDQPARDQRAALSAEAVDVAQRNGDDATLSYALTARFTANWGPENADEQLEIATRLVDLAESIGDRDRAVEARLIRHKVLTYLGDITSARADLQVASRHAEESRQPSHRWFVSVDRVTSALFEGRFEEAEELAPWALQLGRDAVALDADVSYRLHMFALRREQGRAEEVEDLIRRSVSDYPGYPMFRCVLANLYAGIGQAAKAKAILDGLAENGFASLPRDNEWLFAISLLPEVADVLGDVERAAALYEHLSPFAHLHAYSAPELGLGSAGRYAGIAALVAERSNEAVTHLEQALQQNEAMGARPWAAHAMYDLARALMRRDNEGDAKRAHRLLQRCSELSGALEMLVLEMKVASLQEEMASPSGPAGTHVFQREGEYWSILYDGRSLRLKDSKGLRYLGRLLADPGREFHALDLVTGEAGVSRPGPALETPHLVEGDAGELLDARAIGEYRRRLSELESDADEARAMGDPDRATRAETERDLIVDALAGAVGLGGRARRTGDPAERARVSVTKAIRSALDRIKRDCPDLHRHLAATVRTGTYCSYTPDPRVPVTWHSN
jgi:tetratricopeptide (TPR) repeat protein